MAFVNDASGECAKSELDLFQVEPTQVSIEASNYCEYHPISALSDNSDIEFLISGSSDYIDLSNMFLYIKAKITQADDSNLADDAKTAPVNYFLHALISQVDIYLNGTTITSSNSTYPYRSYMEALLSYCSESKKTQLAAALFHKDEARRMDSLDTAGDATNSGYLKRRDIAKKSRVFEMMGRLHADIIFQDRYILSNVDVKLKLSRSKDAFCLMSEDNGVKTKILNAQLFVRKVKVSPSVGLGHAQALQISNAKYPVKRVVVKSVTLPAGISDSSQEKLFHGQIPTRVVIGLVDNRAFNGSRTHNPFNFQHFDLSEIDLFVDGQQQGARPIKTNYADGHYMQGYWSLFTGTGKVNSDETNSILPDDYPGGYALYVYDLSPDLCQGDHFNLVRQGTLRLALKFAKALERAVTVVAYAEYENVIEISNDRSIVFDFSS